MRYVFVGDFSGLSLFLSRGIEALGQEVVLYSNGDGWKGIPRGRSIWSNDVRPILRPLQQVAGAWRLRQALREDDVLVLATEFIFNRHIDASALHWLAGAAGRLVLLHAGCSDGFHAIRASTMLCRECKQHDLHDDNCVFGNDRWPGMGRFFDRIDTVVPFTEAYVPSARQYQQAGSGTVVTAPLHFPIDIAHLEQYQQSDRSRANQVLHGMNRLGFKGTMHLRRLTEARPSLKRLICFPERMPFDQFLLSLGSTEIVLDQLLANGYGMTGALALALGTSVAYGHLDELPTVGFDGTGCIPFRVTGETSVDAIVLEDALVRHLDDRPHPDDVRALAWQRHNHMKVAAQFLEQLK